MSTLRVGIASYEDMKARTMALARGRLGIARNEPKVWFTSTESFAKVLSAGNRELLRVIAERRPGSLDELAFQRELNRSYSWDLWESRS
jgi:predicted transcriptional regulator